MKLFEKIKYKVGSDDIFKIRIDKHFIISSVMSLFSWLDKKMNSPMKLYSQNKLIYKFILLKDSWIVFISVE